MFHFTSTLFSVDFFPDLTSAVLWAFSDRKHLVIVALENLLLYILTLLIIIRVKYEAANTKREDETSAPHVSWNVLPSCMCLVFGPLH